MKLWYQLRKGAYFVDFLLLIAAAAAIVGLAAFVHLHTTKAPHQTSRQGTIGVNTQHLDNLSLEESGSTTPKSPNNSGQAIGPANNSTSSRLQSAMTAPEASSPASSCVKSCDDTVITTPEVKTPQIPIAIDPVVNPIKPCGGLIKRAVNSLLKTEPDHIECPL